MNQRERIYNYMKEHGSITSLECSDKLRITKLTTRLSEMRREGIKIALFYGGYSAAGNGSGERR